MKFQLLLLVFGLGQVLALRANEGCEVTNSWTIDYVWNEIIISAWIPLAYGTSVLSIDVELEGQIKPVTYDNIEIHHNKITVTKIREGKRTPESHQFLQNITDGWRDFVLSLDTYYGFKASQGSSQLPMNISVDYLPKILTFTGSNVTINCQSDVRFWKISNGPVSLPLTSSDQHWVSFFSTTEFSPKIIVEDRHFLFGWNNGSLTTIPALVSPLPPFKEHHLMITCEENNEIICTVEMGEDRKVAEVLRLSKLPKSVTFMRNAQEHFKVLLHNDSPFSKEQDPSCNEDTPLTPKNETTICTGVIVVIVLSISVVLLIGLVGLCKYKKMKFPGRTQRETLTSGLKEGTPLKSSQESGIGSVDEESGYA